MLASLHTGYCLTLESAGLAAKLPFSQALIWEKMSGTARIRSTPEALDNMQAQLEAMELGPLLRIFLQSFFMQFTMTALNIVVFVIVYELSEMKSEYFSLFFLFIIHHII